MRYWDSSAIVPLVIAEPGTELARGWLESDPHLVTWALSRLEIAGAVERRARQGLLDARARRAVLDRVDALANAWDEVIDLLVVRRRALALLARYPLRAADALQLAAAEMVAEGDPSSLSFVCLDRNLAAAADREGFAVLGWPDG